MEYLLSDKGISSWDTKYISGVPKKNVHLTEKESHILTQHKKTFLLGHWNVFFFLRNHTTIIFGRFDFSR